MEMFPEEAGTLDPRKRIIPFLPGKLDLQHSGVTIKSVSLLIQFFAKFFKLGEECSQYCSEHFRYGNIF